LGTLSGGVTPVAEKLEVSNITEIQRDDLTSSNSIIRTRFSAPGGPEINTRGYLDIGSQEFSVYNAMPFRNLSVRGSGSGEQGTIRLDSHASRREGLRTLLTRHSDRFGIDSVHGYVTNSYIVGDASFNKVNRNTRVVVETGSLIITDSFDNEHVSRPIPSQDYGYAWVTASLSEELSPRTTGNQVVFGYWPKDGISKADPDVGWRNNGFDSAVNFPTSSTENVFAGVGIITLVDQPSQGDTFTLNFRPRVDSSFNLVIWTYELAPASAPDDIALGSSVADTRTNTKTKLEAYYPEIEVNINGNNIEITGSIYNDDITETFTSANNVVSGFSGGSENNGLVGVYS
jgi:hypothetical protein